MQKNKGMSDSDPEFKKKIRIRIPPATMVDGYEQKTGIQRRGAGPYFQIIYIYRREGVFNLGPQKNFKQIFFTEKNIFL